MTPNTPGRRRHGLVALAVAAVLGLSACQSSPDAAPPPPETTLAVPVSVETLGVLGDSMSLGVNSCGARDVCTEASWAAGDLEEVDSLATRIEAEQGARPEVVSGAKNGGTVATALDRVGDVVAAQPQLVAVLVGANDACTERIDEMTSVADYRERLGAVVAAIETGAPDATILLLSIPNVFAVWSAGHENPAAVETWSKSPSCQALLDNPGSDAPTDVDRRQAVVDRIDEFNAVIAEVCGAAQRCIGDDGELNRYSFTAEDISTVDYFHPSIVGQGVIAGIAWGALQRGLAG